MYNYQCGKKNGFILYVYNTQKNNATVFFINLSYISENSQSKNRLQDENINIIIHNYLARIISHSWHSTCSFEQMQILLDDKIAL